MDNLHDDAQKINKEICNIDREVEQIYSELKRLHAQRKQLLKKKGVHNANLNKIIKLMKNGGIID